MVYASSCVCGFTARDGGSGEVVTFDMCGGEMGESRAHLSVKQSGGTSWKTVRIAESYQGRKITVSCHPGCGFVSTSRGRCASCLQKLSPLS